MNFYTFYGIYQETYGNVVIAITGITPASEDHPGKVYYEAYSAFGSLLDEDYFYASTDEGFMKFLSPYIQNGDLMTLVGRRFEIDFEIYGAEGKDPAGFYDVDDDENLGVVIESVNEVLT